jgi:polysaccharide deacetylase family protein (PEP-CTERM system associated)
MSTPVANGLSFDIEEWFHVLDLPTTPTADQWNDLPKSVERNTLRLIEILDEYECHATFFILAWVAERYPHLVRAIDEAGHEVASHGSRHELVFEQGQERFREDLQHAKRVLEDITGSEVLGYRAPGFSITEETPWAFETIREVGFLYDSSVFPSPRATGRNCQRSYRNRC